MLFGESRSSSETFGKVWWEVMQSRIRRSGSTFSGGWKKYTAQRTSPIMDVLIKDHPQSTKDTARRARKR